MSLTQTTRLESLTPLLAPCDPSPRLFGIFPSAPQEDWPEGQSMAQLAASIVLPSTTARLFIAANGPVSASRALSGSCHKMEDLIRSEGCSICTDSKKMNGTCKCKTAPRCRAVRTKSTLKRGFEMPAPCTGHPGVQKTPRRCHSTSCPDTCCALGARNFAHL